MKICNELLENYKLKKIINIENINIYLLKTKNKNNISGVVLLKDLIDKGLAAVQEIDDSGRVNTVRVINNSNQDLLLLSGDILEGAKQNRMIMEHVIIKKNSSLAVSVSCVERNRWNYRTHKNFHPADIKISPKIRATKDEYSKNRYTENIQNKIWDDIDKISSKAKMNYFSSDYCEFKDLYNDLDNDKAKNTIENTDFNAYIVEGVGKVFFEYFFSNKLAKSSLLKSIPSYLCDQDGNNLNDIKVLDLSMLKNSQWYELDSIGLGKSFSTDADNLGKAIIYKDEIAHLYFYFK